MIEQGHCYELDIKLFHNLVFYLLYGYDINPQESIK